MNKKLLSLVLVGTLAVTSLPVIGVSAAEFDTSNVKSISSNLSASSRRPVGNGYIAYDASVYYSIGSSKRCAGSNISTVRCAIYTNNTTEANPDWYYVRCKVAGSSTYDYYYVLKSEVTF